MTPREPEPSDFDRSPSSARRDRRDRDRDDRPGHDAGDEPTTGHHRIPDDLRDYASSSRTGRADGTPPAPRRRRGTPPTHGLPVPPPPITKEFVSDDAPRPIGDRPASDFTDSRPDRFRAPVARPATQRSGRRHRSTVRDRPARCRHVKPSSTGRPAERSGPVRRIPRSASIERPLPAARTVIPANRPAMAGTTDVREPMRPRRAQAARPARTPPGDIDSETSSTGETGATPDLRGFGGLRAGVARLGGARVGDALRQRGASPAGGGPRRRFGGTGEQPTIEPNGRGDGTASSSADGAAGRARTSDAEKSGRDRRGFGGSTWFAARVTRRGSTDRGSGVRCAGRGRAGGHWEQPATRDRPSVAVAMPTTACAVDRHTAAGATGWIAAARSRATPATVRSASRPRSCRPSVRPLRRPDHRCRTRGRA